MLLNSAAISHDDCLGSWIVFGSKYRPYDRCTHANHDKNLTKAITKHRISQNLGTGTHVMNWEHGPDEPRRTSIYVESYMLHMGVKRVSEQTWTPPKWMYRDRPPPNNDAYFENMTRVIFLAGLSWNMIDQKWPNFRKAFKNFSIDEVAEFGEKQVEQLMNDTTIIRNRAKIIAAVNNAKQFQNIIKEHGSFRSYLNTLDKSNNYAAVIKELGRKYNRLGPSSARIFLYTVGENIKRLQE